MPNITEILKAAPESLILGVLAIAALIVLGVPLALKIAGLSGQQIADVLAMATRFFLELVREFRAENGSK